MAEAVTCGDKAAYVAGQEPGRRALVQRQVRLRVWWGHWGVLFLREVGGEVLS